MKPVGYLDRSRRFYTCEVSGILTQPLYTAAQLEQARREERERIAAYFDAMPGREMFGGTIADEIRAMSKGEEQ